MTSVKTTSDLRHARVYVSVLGDARAARRDARRPAVRARSAAATHRARSAHEAHAHARVSLRRHDRSRDAPRGDPPPRGPGDVTIAGPAASTRDEVLDALREGERFVLVTHENPDGDALGSLVAMQGVMHALGKDSLMFIGRNEFPLPYEYAFFEFDGLISDVPGDVGERTIVFLDCGNFDRNAVEIGDAPILNIDHHHDNTHFGTVNHVVAEASCTAEIVWDLMRGLDVAADAAGRRGAVRRARDRHRALHVREHRPRRAPDGGRPDRRRRRRARDLPAALRGHARAQARAAGARAERRPALRRRPDHVRAARARRLRADRRREVPHRGDHRSPARDRRARRSPRSRASSTARTTP